MTLSQWSLREQNLFRPALGHGKLRQLQGYMLLLCGMAVVWVTLWGSMAALAHPAQHARYQESPLSPLVSPLTTTAILTETIVVTSPPVQPTAAAPVLVNLGQTSLFLVGAVLVGLLVVIILVIWRR